MQENLAPTLSWIECFTIAKFKMISKSNETVFVNSARNFSMDINMRPRYPVFESPESASLNNI